MGLKTRPLFCSAGSLWCFQIPPSICSAGKLAARVSNALSWLLPFSSACPALAREKQLGTSEGIMNIKSEMKMTTVASVT